MLAHQSILVNPTHATQQANLVWILLASWRQTTPMQGPNETGYLSVTGLVCFVAESGGISYLTYAKNIIPCQITDGTNEIKYTDPVNRRENKQCDIILTPSEIV